MTAGFGVDVCVIGAGPAGSVLATRLAQLDLRVLLVERTPFPRPHLGESLTPGVEPMLAGIGAEWIVPAADARRVTAVRRLWGDDPQTLRSAGGLIVDRARFDEHLLRHARAHGVEVWHPATWLGHETASDGTVTVRISRDGAERRVRTRMLAMATGRSRGPSRVRPLVDGAPRTLALYAYWGGEVPDEPAIESLSDAWCWGVPIPGLGYNALVFVDAMRVQSRADVDSVYRQSLAASRLVVPHRGTLLTTPQSADATPTIAAASIQDGVIAVGDAALALDPLSSSGVQKAMQNALAAAVVVNTIIRRPTMRTDAEICYERVVSHAARHHTRWGANFYAAAAAAWPTSTFWHERAGAADLSAHVVHSFSPPEPPLVHPDQPLMPDPAIVIAPCPCLGESFVTREEALVHPAWEEPVAFVGGHAVAPLFALAHAGETANSLVARSGLPTTQARQLVRWMIDRAVLTPMAAGAAIGVPYVERS